MGKGKEVWGERKIFVKLAQIDRFTEKQQFLFGCAEHKITDFTVFPDVLIKNSGILVFCSILTQIKVSFYPDSAETVPFFDQNEIFGTSELGNEKCRNRIHDTVLARRFLHVIKVSNTHVDCAIKMQ